MSRKYQEHKNREPTCWTYEFILKCMELVIKLRLFKKQKLLKEETVNNYNDHTPDETIMYVYAPCT